MDLDDSYFIYNFYYDKKHFSYKARVTVFASLAAFAFIIAITLSIFLIYDHRSEIINYKEKGCRPVM